jgi:hypothetical protein
MADELDHYRQLLMDDCSEAHALATEARALLAQPEPQGPSDEELLELMPETMRDEFSYAAKVCSDATGGQVKPGIFRVCLNHSALEYARAVLARWGRPAIAARRPKPPSLKEQALKALNSASFQPGTDFRQIDPARSAIIRRALEQLDD